MIKVFFEIYLPYSVRARVDILYLMDTCHQNKTMTLGVGEWGWGGGERS